VGEGEKKRKERIKEEKGKGELIWPWPRLVEGIVAS